MSVRVALRHRTSYTYDRPISLGPQVVRLRPAPHCRTPILAYSLSVKPETHFLNWQQDPQGNYLARLVFPEKTDRLEIDVHLLVEMVTINPFDFFLEPFAEKYPFEYPKALKHELEPYFEFSAHSPAFDALVAGLRMKDVRTIDFAVEVNRRVQQALRYVIRLEPGVQTPDESLEKASGSCRDSTWLLVQVFRHLGIAARFVSGYLIQLAPDEKPLEGPEGPSFDFTDLHAWCEVYLPGAGWVGLDPTSGLLAGEGHIPLAASPDPTSAAPITGMMEEAKSTLDHEMTVERQIEAPRVTKPYTEEQWQDILQAGDTIDEKLDRLDVRLTMGGEPTFVSIDDMEGAEWNGAAVGPNKRRIAQSLLLRLRERFAPGGLLHFGMGKWYPGESLPRWSFGCYWRKDGVPIWINDDLFADLETDYGFGAAEARAFGSRLADRLGVGSQHLVLAYEDVFYYLWKENKLPYNVPPWDPKFGDAEERDRLIRIFQRGVNAPVGCVLPIKRQSQQGRAPWVSGKWPVRAEKMFLLPGDSPMGLRLPIDTLPWVPTKLLPLDPERDPFEELDSLPAHPLALVDGIEGQPYIGFALSPERSRLAFQTLEIPPEEVERVRKLRRESWAKVGSGGGSAKTAVETEEDPVVDAEVVRTALCVEPRDGRLHVFMPPVYGLEDYLDLVTQIEATAVELDMPIVLEGYLPPHDPRLNSLKNTPDPGVIEVNVHPSANWQELVETTEAIYEEARQVRLGTDKFDVDGRHTGTGGGNHVVLGGATPPDSPFLRRPDLLKSMLGFWNNHPSLSYLFSGKFIGPTSQAPRVDEGRRDSIYELEIAFAQTPPAGEYCPPWLVDRLYRHLLVDLTGNTHRAEFCIDKLFSPDSLTGRLGLVELRAMEMPPHARMSLVQQLLIRGIVAAFWEKPYDRPLAEWGTRLHDEFLLPRFAMRDFRRALAELERRGVSLPWEWFAPHFEFRFPFVGETEIDGMRLEIRQAIEPWYVLGEEPGGGGTVRYVDSSVERMQASLTGGEAKRHILTCNGRRVPLSPTETVGEMVGGVRFRAWRPPSCLHPTIAVHSPLTFELLDAWTERSLGGCTYHVVHPGGRSFDTFPVNALEAESRRAARFFPHGFTAGRFPIPPLEPNDAYPLTLDMRRSPSGNS